MRGNISFVFNQLAKTIGVISLALFQAGCASVEQVGEIGPKKLKVYSVAHNDFLSASRMLVILDDKGNLSASSGGTVAGGGALGLQTAASVAGAGAVLYGAKAIQHGLENAKIKGIPSDFSINANANIHASGEYIHHNE
jgi:hypothetical protein